MSSKGRVQLQVATLVVLLIYALPLLAAYTFQHRLLYAETTDDSFYEMRVLDLYRGGTLGNPYVVEHQTASRYMPDLVERALAWCSRALHFEPLKLVAVTRAVFPVCIFLVVFVLARNLGFDVLEALLAGFLTVLAPSSSVGGYALRYFRVISPAAYILLVLLTLLLLERLWARCSWPATYLAAAGLGPVLYTPVYYWSFIFLGLGLLSLWTSGRTRRALIVSGTLGVALGSPSLLHSLRVSGDPMVRETLARLNLMVPGRALEPKVLPRFILGLALISIAVWFARNQQKWAKYLLPFAIAATYMLVQNVITNRQLQAYHMINCLVPLAALCVVGILHALKPQTSVMYALIGLVIVAGFAVQVSAYVSWSRNVRETPGQYAVNTAFPRTLEWLNRETPADSVVVFPEEMEFSAPLFTHNRTYIGYYVFQYVISTGEIVRRDESRSAWSPGKDLPYRADYVLGIGSQCQNWGSRLLLFHDPAEGTCVFSLHP